MEYANYFLVALLIAVFAILITGIGLMVKGGEMNRKYGNKMMVARVGFQAVIVLLLGVMFLIGKH